MESASSVPVLQKLVREAVLPRVRLQSLSALNAIQGTTWRDLKFAIQDTSPQVRAFAIQSMEPFLQNLTRLESEDVEILDSFIEQALQDSNRGVIRQLALTLGETSHPIAGAALVAIARDWSEDDRVRRAILSSATPHVKQMLTWINEHPEPLDSTNWIQPLQETMKAATQTAERDLSQTIKKSSARQKNSSESLSLNPLTPEKRDQVLARYKGLDAILGNPESGRKVFETYCSQCHFPQDNGVQLGPDLAPLRGKDHAYWVQNILDPGAVVEPRYVAYQINLRSGDSLMGWIRNETANGFQLISVSGEVQPIRNSEIESQRALKTSLMPAGYESILDPQAMADLLTWLNR